MPGSWKKSRYLQRNGENKMILLLILAGGILAQILAEKYYEKHWTKGLKVEIRFQKEPVRQGEEGFLTETIENEKRLFLPVLQAGFAVSRNLSFGQEENTSVSDQSYKRDVFSVMGRQRIIRKVPFQALKRGYYEIQKTDLVTRGILLAGEQYETLPCSTYLYVYPKRISGEKWETLFRRISGVYESRKRLLEDPFQFRGIREYTPDDPMNKINWKASARTGSLMVNQLNSAVFGNVYILLDVEDETVWKYEEIHEEGIRLAAAAAEYFLSRGIETGLITNGRDCKEKSELFLTGQSGRSQGAKFLQCLSRIDLGQKSEKFSDCLKRKKEFLIAKESLCILITKNQYQELEEILAELGRKNHGSIYLTTLYPEMKLKIKRTQNMEVLNWEVRR